MNYKTIQWINEIKELKASESQKAKGNNRPLFASEYINILVYICVCVGIGMRNAGVV